MKKTVRLLALLLLLALTAGLLAACGTPSAGTDPDCASAPTAEPLPAPSTAGNAAAPVVEDGVYTAPEELARYIRLYGHLPANFITKAEARAAGWTGGSLEPFFPGMCIGGDRFGNREGLLPEAEGRVWTECDVNTLGASSRGAERLVFSNDGLIYYTGDHYESFQLLEGAEMPD